MKLACLLPLGGLPPRLSVGLRAAIFHVARCAVDARQDMLNLFAASLVTHKLRAAFVLSEQLSLAFELNLFSQEVTPVFFQGMLFTEFWR